MFEFKQTMFTSEPQPAFRIKAGKLQQAHRQMGIGQVSYEWRDVPEVGDDAPDRTNFVGGW